MVVQDEKTEKRACKQRMRRVHPHAAGIDLGSRTHYVAVGPDVVDNPVEKFDCCTPGLEAMALWLKQCSVTTVAMEATGVYWIPVYQVLERHGLEVVLVNAQHFRCVPGRKSDVQDCQWLQHLHECGLLRGSFRPEDAIVVLRTYVRQRDNLVAESSRHVQRMQKALEQMNVQLHKMLSDITGESGMAIIEAILGGCRDPGELAKLCNYRVHRTPEQIADALTADYREEHLFCLKQELMIYKHLQRAIGECEEAMARRWAGLRSSATVSEAPAAKNRYQDKPQRLELYRVAGVDLTAIDGMSIGSVMKIIAEVGLDMTKWPTEKHFASWLRLCPNNRITGGRVHSGKTLPSKNRAADVFRKCAENLARSQSYLGALYRRKRAHRGGSHAVVVVAHRLAKIFYQTLKQGRAYVDLGAKRYEASYKDRQLKSALNRIHALGYHTILEELPMPA